MNNGAFKVARNVHLLLKNCFTKLFLCRTISMLDASMVHKHYSGCRSLLKHFTIGEQIFLDGSVTGGTVHTQSSSIVSFCLAFCPSQSKEVAGSQLPLSSDGVSRRRSQNFWGLVSNCWLMRRKQKGIQWKGVWWKGVRWKGACSCQK